MPHFHGNGAQTYPCVKCEESIPSWDGIFCDLCTNWFHFKCDQLEIQHQDAFRELPEAPYICKSCRSDEKGVFSFSRSLERLQKGAKQGIEKLFMYAERERQFMKEDFSFSNSKSTKFVIDQQAELLVREFCPLQKKRAAKVTRDGNSLFSAVSMALVGNEKLAVELRVRCCIEMVVFEDWYKWNENCTELERCAPEYHVSSLNCATPGEDSCVWTMSALASVVRRRIESIYPCVNKADVAVSILNTVFSPRNGKVDGEDIKIFWGGPRKSDVAPGSWVPDVFVPLMDIPSVPQSPVAVSPYLTPSRVSGRVRKPTPKVLAITNKKIKTEVKVVVEDSMEEEADFKMPLDFTLEPTDEDILEQKYKIEKINLNWMDKYGFVAEGGKPLKGTAFLPAQEVFNELISTKEVCPSIPLGRKEDVYFIVDNSKNIRYKNRRNYFQDDCGRYDQRSGTTCKSFYMLSCNNMLQQLIKDKGKYCKESRRVTASENDNPRGGRGRPQSRNRSRSRIRGGAATEQKVTKWIPMDPQPEEDQVVTLHRYYSSLEVDPTFKRRISWFSNLPDRIENGQASFLVEYITKPVAGLVLPASRKGGVFSHTPGMDDEMAEEGMMVSDTDTNSQSEDVEMPDQMPQVISMIDPMTGVMVKLQKTEESPEKAMEDMETQDTQGESQNTLEESQTTQTESQNSQVESQSTQEEIQNAQVESQDTHAESQNTQVESQVYTQAESQNTQVESQVYTVTQAENQNPQEESQTTPAENQNPQEESQSIQEESQPTVVEATSITHSYAMEASAEVLEGTGVTLLEDSEQGHQMQIIYVQESSSQTL